MKKVSIIVPQYQSSYCIDDCKYCGFRKTNSVIPRKRLNDEDFKKEIDLLLQYGYRTIEFVYASDRYFSPDAIAKRIEYVKNLGIKRGLNLRIGLNSEPFDYKGYKTLVNSGLDFFVIWMETYNKEKYNFWHGNKTPKSNYEVRYSAYEIAIDAGLKNYGMGILFGLNDLEEDTDALMMHAKYLTQKSGFEPYIFGVPRVKRANSVVIDEKYSLVDDISFGKAIKKYKDNFPNTMIFYNTRESFELNMELCQNSDLFTIDCGTYPGAYLHPKILDNDTEQFHTIPYERERIIEEMNKNNIQPIFEW